ncbi:YdaU family protein [Azonexus sp. IMCC34839]|uniref:YdaU family protein n=1 Tax=Azonexus sp. IMCC34839 TaxID=3133695 RepID=UPI0039997A03
MSKTDIWMPLYIADYLADTTRLTTEQHGAYLLLIMDYWRNGPLPDDDGALANITRLTTPAWKKNRSTLARLFRVEGGEWRHKRIDEELNEAAANSKKYAERAKKAAAKRWGKQSLDDASSNANSTASSNAYAELDQCTSPSPSPSQVNPLSEEKVVGDLPSLDWTAGNATRAGSLCKQLRVIGIDAAPHLPAWTDLLDRFTDEQIISVAEIAKARKPGERIHLNYLVPILNEPPKAPNGTRRAPAADNFDNRDYGQGGRL